MTSLTADVNPTPAPTLEDIDTSCSHPLQQPCITSMVFPHIPNNAGTGHPSFWKVSGIVPMEGGPLVVSCPSFAPPRKPRCCSAAPALFPGRITRPPLLPRERAHHLGVREGLKLLVCPGHFPATLYLPLLGFLLSIAWQGAGWSLPGNQQAEADQHHPGSTVSPVTAPPARAPGT